MKPRAVALGTLSGGISAFQLVHLNRRDSSLYNSYVTSIPTPYFYLPKPGYLTLSHSALVKLSVLVLNLFRILNPTPLLESLSAFILLDLLFSVSCSECAKVDQL